MFSETWNSAELGILICKSRVGKEKNHVENNIFSKNMFQESDFDVFFRIRGFVVVSGDKTGGGRCWWGKRADKIEDSFSV